MVRGAFTQEGAPASPVGCQHCVKPALLCITIQTVRPAPASAPAFAFVHAAAKLAIYTRHEHGQASSKDGWHSTRRFRVFCYSVKCPGSTSREAQFSSP